MTTLAKIEANRRNAQLSTGPRTAEGRVVVSRNATKHGIFAAVPVLPGESAEEWEVHRTGVVASLSPFGLLEVNLAERAALLLWRLQRLARYEAETVAAEIETAEVPPLPPPKNPIPLLFPPSQQPTREDQLRDLREELRTARRELAEVISAWDYFTEEAGTDAAVAFAVAEGILEAARGRAETAENLRSDPPAVGSKALMRKIGLTGADPRTVAWTPDLICRGLAVYARFTEEPVEQFVGAVGTDLDEWAEELTRTVRRLEREAAAVARLLDGQTARKRAAKLLPGDGRDERIAKYERHLHGLLTSTLHELERLQARREGDAVPPPAVVDVTVTGDAGLILAVGLFRRTGPHVERYPARNLAPTRGRKSMRGNGLRETWRNLLFRV